MIRKINDYLALIKVVLPNSPLRDLNSYVVQTPSRNLLIDTGYYQPESLESLQNGIQELGIDMDKTDILLTHLHADHSGLVSKIARPGCKIYMGEVDNNLRTKNLQENYHWIKCKELYLQEGFPADIIEYVIRDNSAKSYAPEKFPQFTPLKEGDILSVGKVSFNCIDTPGHTPGHICLYNADNKIMVLGDHVLFGITPNITTWPTLRNSLKTYMNSLRKIREYDVLVPLPGHRECTGTMIERIDKLLEHHEKRLAETYRLVSENEGLNGYELAGLMKWSIRACNWEKFPAIQKWFATGETLAHLYYLEENGDIRRETPKGGTAYSVSSRF